jgi:hypothetical protein
MQLSLRLSFHLRHRLGGYTVGTTLGFQVEIVEALAPQTSPLNPTEVPTVACEHLFRLLLRGPFFLTHSNGRHMGCCWGKLPQCQPGTGPSDLPSPSGASNFQICKASTMTPKAGTLIAWQMLKPAYPTAYTWEQGPVSSPTVIITRSWIYVCMP